MQNHATSRIKHTNIIHDLGFGEQFLDTATKTQSISGKKRNIYIYILDFVKKTITVFKILLIGLKD